MKISESNKMATNNLLQVIRVWNKLRSKFEMYKIVGLQNKGINRLTRNGTCQSDGQRAKF